MALACLKCFKAFSLSESPENNPMFSPSCGHAYHLSCIKQWLKSYSTCPICQRAVLESQLLRLHLTSVSNGNLTINPTADGSTPFDPEEDQEIKDLERERKRICGDIALEEDRIRKVYSYIKDINKNVQHINIELAEHVIDLCDSISESHDIPRALSAAGSAGAPSTSGRNSPSFLPRPSSAAPGTIRVLLNGKVGFARPVTKT